jgi:hypothetical protein
MNEEVKMLAAIKAKVTNFFYPTTLENAIQQNKADEALKLITDAAIPIDTLYGNFTILGLAVIWDCHKLTLELVKRGANANLGGMSALQAAVNATGDARDLANAVLFVAHGASLLEINFRNNPGYKPILQPIAEEYKKCKKLEAKFKPGDEDYLEKNGAASCTQLAKYWQKIANLSDRVWGTPTIYKDYYVAKAEEYIAKARQYTVTSLRSESEEVLENEHAPLLGIRQRPNPTSSSSSDV